MDVIHCKNHATTAAVLPFLLTACMVMVVVEEADSTACTRASAL